MSMEREVLAAPRRRNKSVERQEELTWDRFYPQARRDATLALEILNELDRDESLRRRHLGLCLSCQRCIRLHKNREARNRRVGRLVRASFAAVFVAAPQALWRSARHGGQLLLACLPGGDMEPDDGLFRRELDEDTVEEGDPSLRIRARKAADRQEASSREVPPRGRPTDWPSPACRRFQPVSVSNAQPVALPAGSGDSTRRSAQPNFRAI
ncbi:hypothetical protein ACQ859_16415 [Roseateles chitinivorans]|uniref:hypothetical protein n=1 Tax=Roseateles chitinivorans TaxID=2917965 RepID=UPI003D67F0F8